MFSPNPYVLNENRTPLRRRMAKHPRPHARQRQQRARRSATPSTLERVKQAKQAGTADAKRQRMKKQKANEQRKRRSQALMRQRRERWGAIALETQNIVLGDGKYVEERLAPSLSHPMTQLSDAQGPPPAVVPIVHDIASSIVLSQQRTVLYPHYCPQLGPWKDARPSSPFLSTRVEFSRKSTLNVARQLALSHSSDLLQSSQIGLLSSASDKRNSSYLIGSSEQEDVIKRSSSLVANLTGPVGQAFYDVHRSFRKEDRSGLHDHAMLYSPGVVVFRKDCDDDTLSESDPSSPSRKERDLVGGDFIPPYIVNVVSAVPVNAAMVRSNHRIEPGEESFFEDGIRASMKERMARVLRAFELNGDKVLVLGAFGCSFENQVETVASIWAELLDCGETVGDARQVARFKYSFEKVVFAVPGKLYEPFKKAYEMRILEEQLTSATLEN